MLNLIVAQYHIQQEATLATHTELHIRLTCQTYIAQPASCTVQRAHCLAALHVLNIKFGRTL